MIQMLQLLVTVHYKLMVILSVVKGIYNELSLIPELSVVAMGSSSSAAVSADGILNINNDTDATTTSNGSLQTVVVYRLQVFIMEQTLH